MVFFAERAVVVQEVQRVLVGIGGNIDIVDFWPNILYIHMVPLKFTGLSHLHGKY